MLMKIFLIYLYRFLLTIKTFPIICLPFADLIFDQINVDEQSIKFPASSDRMKIDTFLELPKQESNTGK